MKKIAYFLAMGTIAFAACTEQAKEQPTTVHLKGQLIDMGSTEVTMKYDGAASMLGDSRDIHLITDAEGRFDTIVTITEPTYYSISRNTLYLTPGDDMTVKITPNNKEAEFQGKGAIANNYMKYRLFPKGGSFLEAGENLRKDFASTKALVDSLAQVRQQQLDALDSVSSEFKELETMRIKADVLNSYISYAGYSGMMYKAKTREEAKAMYDEFRSQLTPYVQPIFSQLNQDKYLDVAVVRNVLGYIAGESDTEWGKGITLSAKTKELYDAEKYVDILRKEINTQVADSVRQYIATMKHAEFATEVEAKLKQASRLLPGQPAFDIEMKDVNGKVCHLSDLKGKVLYVDLWATWCGPCCAESPHFESLSKEYQGKDIVFVPISTDTNKKAWLDYIKMHKKELTQYNTVDPNIRSQWGVLYIPRFLVIGKDFKIINAYAPVPSDKANIKALLDAALAQN